MGWTKGQTFVTNNTHAGGRLQTKIDKQKMPLYSSKKFEKKRIESKKKLRKANAAKTSICWYFPKLIPVRDRPDRAGAHTDHIVPSSLFIFIDGH